jgi:hypothetical protein
MPFQSQYQSQAWQESVCFVSVVATLFASSAAQTTGKPQHPTDGEQEARQPTEKEARECKGTRFVRLCS